MYVCMYVRMYVCIYIYIYIYVCIYVRVLRYKTTTRGRTKSKRRFQVREYVSDARRRGMRQERIIFDQI